MNTALVASIIVPLIAGAGGLIGYFKFRPGQREEVELKVDRGYFEVAQGTFSLVTKEMEEQFKRMAADIAELHSEVSGLRETVRTVTSERDGYARENRELKSRVEQLERQVDELRNGS